MRRCICWCACSALVGLVVPDIALAAADVWDGNGGNPPNGNWETGNNWGDNSTPLGNDTATFNLLNVYTVTFGANPAAIQALTVGTGAVTFTSSGGTRTLNVTSATGGQDVTVTGAGTVLTLGTAGNQLNLAAGDDLAVLSGATLNIRFGGDVQAADFGGTGLNGTIDVDGIGSSLSITSASLQPIATAADGSLVVQNGASASIFRLGVSDTAALNGSVSVLSGGSLSMFSHLTIATGNLAGQTGSVAINGVGSLLTQGGGASNITVGSATNGSAAIDIGTSSSGGTLTTGGGTTTINATGTVTIGSGANSATLNANGNVTVDGGLLQRGSGGTFALASGKTMTVQNNGTASFTGDYTTTSSANYNITGAGSEWNLTGSLTIGNSAQVNASSSGLVSTGGLLNIGNGTFNVDGATAQSSAASSSTWGTTAAGAANVTFSNDATGTFAGGIGLAQTAFATAVVDVLSGADLSVGNLSLATSGASASATLNVQGSGSTVTQSGATTALTVGHATAGTAVVNIGTTTSGGVFSTDTGLTTVNATGTVNIGSGANTGTFNANGDVTINGGTLSRANGSVMNLAAGKTMTIQNGGDATFAGNYNTGNAIYNVTGGGSTLQTTSGGSLMIGSGALVNVDVAGRLSTDQDLDIGDGSSGTLVVDGVGSLALVNGSGWSYWGDNGGTATVTFRNNALPQFTVSGSLGLAESSTAGTTALVNFETGADLIVGNLALATAGGATTSATLNINGGNSSVFMNGASTLTVGHASTGTAAINIGTTASGGMLTTGTGTMTLNRTGTVTVGSGANTGTLNVNGNLTIDGGDLTVGSGSTFALATGKTMTVQNGGLASFSSNYTTAPNAIYNMTGANSRLESISGYIFIQYSALVNVTAGGSLAATKLRMADTGDGKLSVDGTGSSVVTSSGETSDLGLSGSTATVTFSNGATGTFNGPVALAEASSSTATLDVQSGADVSMAGLSLVGSAQPGSSATLTVTGNGSTVTLTPGTSLTIGYDFSGTAEVNVLDGGALAVGTGGSTTLNATGTLNIDGGSADLKTFNVNGGTLNFTAGSLSYLGDLTVGTGGLLGEDLTLDNTRQLTLSGTTTIDSFHTLTLDGGSFSTGSLVVNGTLAFNSGTLAITGAGGLTIGSGGPLGSAFTLGPGRTLNVTNTTTVDSGALFVLESGGTFTSGTLANSGTVVLDGPAAVLGGTTLTNTGLLRGEGVVSANMTNAANGEIRAQAGKTLTLIGANGTNAGTVNLQSGTLEFSQALVNGSSGQILGRGTLIVGGVGLTNNGHVALSSGITDVFGDVNNNTGSATVGITVSGNADVTFWDDVTNVAGSLFRVSAGSSATFFGTFSGAGISGTGNTYFEADVSPGASPAAVEFGGNVFLGSNATLNIELGGTTPGAQYDRLAVGFLLTLDGTLEVLLINGFTPAAGNSFDILDWGSVTGLFDTLQLPALGTDLMWNASQLYTTGALSVALAGDFNFDGVVDAADYVVWRKGLGTTYTTDDYNVWRAHFGQTAGSGAALAASTSNRADAGIPEPASLVLISCGAAGAALVLNAARRRAGSSTSWRTLP